MNMKSSRRWQEGEQGAPDETWAQKETGAGLGGQDIRFSNCPICQEWDQENQSPPEGESGEGLQGVT